MTHGFVIDADGPNELDLFQAFGIYWDSSKFQAKPRRNVEVFTVPGRNGALIIDEGTYDNITLSFSCHMHGNFDIEYANFLKYMNSFGGKYIRFTIAPDDDHYRFGVFQTPDAPVIKTHGRDGYFDLVFNCKPQRYIVGKYSWCVDWIPSLGSPYQLSNYTAHPAKPLLEVHGSGVIRLGDTQMAIASNSTGITLIDCELEECLDGNGENANNKVSLSANRFPVINPGGSDMYVLAGISEIQIATRLWEL